MASWGLAWGTVLCLVVICLAGGSRLRETALKLFWATIKLGREHCLCVLWVPAVEAMDVIAVCTAHGAKAPCPGKWPQARECGFEGSHEFGSI